MHSWTVAAETEQGMNILDVLLTDCVSPQTENFLKHKIRSRPERAELVRMHILQGTADSQHEHFLYYLVRLVHLSET